MSRLSSGGLIDRESRFRITVDGKSYPAHGGDTLASALLASGVRVMGRSFKYHRPRGVFAAGAEEPSALFEIGRKGSHRPNVRATQQEAFDGLRAESQNRWPSLRFDALEVNDLLAPFLGAGFYYKTFMWPKAFWERVYEPVIRRAAGLGTLPTRADTAGYEKGWLHADLLVIGAGPAGLSAALRAAEAGRDVVIAEADFLPGGSLLGSAERVGGAPGAAWAAEAWARLRAMPTVTCLSRTTVTGVYDGRTFGALQRVSRHIADADDALPAEIFWRIVAPRAVLATGAHERPIAFPGNDRPGVMLANAVRHYLHRFAVAPGRRLAVFTANDSGWQTARDWAAAGLPVGAIIDARDDVHPPEGPWRVFTGAAVTATEGRLGLRRIQVRDAKQSRWVEADLLAVSGGWSPVVHLSCHLGSRPVWDEAAAAFLPERNAIRGLTPAGAASGAQSTHAALQTGRAAAETLLDLTDTPSPLPEADAAPYTHRAFWHVADAKGRAFVDLQNDVTVKDIRQSVEESFRSVEHMKRYTTLGMATDQGKTANVLGLAILAEATGQSIAETGTTTFRPPYTATTIGAIGAHGGGKGFQPVRQTPTHALALAANAPMLEAGLWLRPAYFPRAGERTWREACDREVGMVRGSVGVADVSTLGKIEVSGPDAARFLDRIYTGTMSRLRVGRVRYGLMLREDGFVMDDGTCARLAEDQYLVTTTTAAAGPVMAHMEFAAECLWPGDAVRLISATDHWAQIAVAGPAARQVVASVTAADLSPEALPFMAWSDAVIAGVPGRIFRISFSGELGYELAVPAGHGETLMARLVAAAEAAGGGLYGMEALNVLRIEKGFLTHAEIDGRVTADDLGLSALVSFRKDFIGRAMARRPGLRDPRPQLVGLVPVEAGAALEAGAHILPLKSPVTADYDEGHVSSACHSPTLGHRIALGFLRNGRVRHGDRVMAADPLRGQMTPCTVTAPGFVDPSGGRMRG